MFERVRSLSLLAAVVAFLLAAPVTYAQTTFGSIVGNVTDPSGAAVGNTEVTLTNLGTNEKRTDTTSSDGLYQFVNLPPGQYSVGVQKPGFKGVLRSPVTVQTQTTTKIDLALQVGEVSQTVEVTSQTPLLQPETSTLGQVIDQRKTNTLPLNGRNPLNLVALVPSVVPQGGSMSNPNGQNPFAWGNYQIGGGMANQSMVWLDGSPVNGSYINITALIPTQDSLQEFKVATNNLSPEYGRFAGASLTSPRNQAPTRCTARFGNTCGTRIWTPTIFSAISMELRAARLRRTSSASMSVVRSSSPKSTTAKIRRSFLSITTDSAFARAHRIRKPFLPLKSEPVICLPWLHRRGSTFTILSLRAELGRLARPPARPGSQSAHDRPSPAT